MGRRPPITDLRAYGLWLLATVEPGQMMLFEGRRERAAVKTARRYMWELAEWQKSKRDEKDA